MREPPPQAQALHRSCKHRAWGQQHGRPHYPHPRHHHGHRLKGRRPSLYVRGTHTKRPHPPSSSSSKRKPVKREEHAALGDYGKADDEEVGGKRRARRLLNGAARWAAAAAATRSGGSVVVEAEKAWSARRRDPRINGADIYVARVTKVGMGSARPCWRCVEWCRWAGVKRIFHWNGEESRFDVVKVNTAERDQYETHADLRLSAGMVRSRFVFPFRWSAFFLFSDAWVYAGLVASAITIMESTRH